MNDNAKWGFGMAIMVIGFFAFAIHSHYKTHRAFAENGYCETYEGSTKVWRKCEVCP